MSALEPTVMPADEARERFARVGAAVSTARDDLTALYAGRAWLSLGYGSWDEACDAMLGVRVALPREERREVVGEMREQGMPVRAIASALGVSVGTVQADRSELNSRGFAEPERVTSLDGRERPATQPPRVVTEPEPPTPGLGDQAAVVSATPDPGGVPAPAPGMPEGGRGAPSSFSIQREPGGLRDALAEQVESFASDSEDIRRLTIRRDLLKWLGQVRPFDVDPEEAAASVEDGFAWDDLARRRDEAVAYFDALLSHRPKRLNLVKGDS